MLITAVAGRENGMEEKIEPWRQTNPPNHVTLSSVPFPESGAGLMRSLVSSGRDRPYPYYVLFTHDTCLTRV